MYSPKIRGIRKSITVPPTPRIAPVGTGSV